MDSSPSLGGENVDKFNDVSRPRCSIVDQFDAKASDMGMVKR